MAYFVPLELLVAAAMVNKADTPDFADTLRLPDAADCVPTANADVADVPVTVLAVGAIAKTPDVCDSVCAKAGVVKATVAAARTMAFITVLQKTNMVGLSKA